MQLPTCNLPVKTRALQVANSLKPKPSQRILEKPKQEIFRRFFDFFSQFFHTSKFSEKVGNFPAMFQVNGSFSKRKMNAKMSVSMRNPSRNETECFRFVSQGSSLNNDWCCDFWATRALLLVYNIRTGHFVLADSARFPTNILSVIIVAFRRFVLASVV